MPLLKKHVALSVATLSLFFHSQANAQNLDRPAELNEIFACKTLTDSLARLACYDKAVGLFEAAEQKGEVVTVSKSAIEKVERDAFGFNIPSLPSLGNLFGGSDKDKKTKAPKSNDLTDPVRQVEVSPPSDVKTNTPSVMSKPKATEIDEVSLEIRKTTEFGYKKVRFFMANGQVWEQTDGKKIRIPKVRNGVANRAKISKASLGSFFLRVNGSGTAIRVRRVR